MRGATARGVAAGTTVASVAFIVGKLVLAYVDRLEIRSAPGQGTTIAAHLPIPAAGA
jgi:hypothetical protein